MRNYMAAINAVACCVVVHVATLYLVVTKRSAERSPVKGRNFYEKSKHKAVAATKTQKTKLGRQCVRHGPE